MPVAGLNPQDGNEAAAAFLYAALRGDANGMYHLATLLLQDGDVEAACGWCLHAYYAGHPLAADALGAFPAEMRINRLRSWAEQHYRRFASEGDLAGLDQAIAVAREAAAAARGHPLRAESSAELRDVLRKRIDRTEQLADMDEAVAAGREALAGAEPSRPADVVELAVLLRNRFARTGRPADLEEALTISRRCARELPPADPFHSRVLTTLSAVLATRCQHVAVRRSDLDEAVAAGRSAAAVPAGGDDEQANMSANLGAALLLRFMHLGQSSDLDEAISVLRRAVGVASPGWQNQAGALANLAQALRARAQRTGRRLDADEADELAAPAARAAPAAPAGMRRVLPLAIHTGDDAEPARAMLSQIPPGDPRRPTALVVLAATLANRGDPADVDAAIGVLHEAVAAAPTGHPDRAEAQWRAYRTGRRRRRLRGAWRRPGPGCLHFPDPDRCHGLIGEQATREAVRQGLTTHSWAHLACHGSADWSDPSQSAFALWDGRLSALDIADLHNPAGDFAFLSACHTATGGTRLPDEAIHLASALQLIGYRHVIGTLWAIKDSNAPSVAASVYQALGVGDTLDADHAARALHDTVVRLHTEDRTDPTVWAPYIHVGP